MRLTLTISFLLLSQMFSSAQVNFSHLPYDSASAAAIRNGKLLLVDFRADWCKPCIEMEKTTFLDPDLGHYVNSRFLSVKVDVDQFSGMDLRDQFNVNQYPTILVIEPSDQEVYLRLIGFKTASILMGDLKMLDVDEEPLPAPEQGPKSDSEVKKTTEPQVQKKECFLKRWFRKLFG